jgi:hypothetical protein
MDKKPVKKEQPENIMVICGDCHQEYTTSSDLLDYHCPHCLEKKIFETMYNLQMNAIGRSTADIIQVLKIRMFDKNLPLTPQNFNAEAELLENEIAARFKADHDKFKFHIGLRENLKLVGTVLWVVLLIAVIVNLVVNGI